MFRGQFENNTEVEIGLEEGLVYLDVYYGAPVQGCYMKPEQARITADYLIKYARECERHNAARPLAVAS